MALAEPTPLFLPEIFIPDQDEWFLVAKRVAGLYEREIRGPLVSALGQGATTGVMLVCDEVIAAVTVSPNCHTDDFGAHASLDRIAVDKEYQRLGYGRWLMAFAAHVAVTSGDILLIAQPVSDDSRGLLRGLHFTDNGEFWDLEDQALIDLAATYQSP